MNYLTPYSLPNNSSPFLGPLPPYPIDSFPGLLGSIARSLDAGRGVPAATIGTVLTAIASSLTQGSADVVWPNGQTTSIGANGLVIDSSAHGKSLPYKILRKAIEQTLAMLTRDFPESGIANFLLEDASPEAIVESLHACPVATLGSDEAGALKKVLKAGAMLVKLVEGGPVRRARISTGFVTLPQPRFSMLFMEQPAVFDETKRLLGIFKGGIGLINRFFVAWPANYPMSGSPHYVRLSADVEKAYEKKVRELMNALVKFLEGEQERPVLALSPEAKQYLIDLDHQARRKCMPDSPWFFISEYIMRHAERVLRLAGVFHVFEYGVEGEISIDTLRRAETFGDWYIESFAQVCYEPPKLTQAEMDAGVIERALIDSFHMTGYCQFLRSDMQKQSLGLGLTPARFTRGLAELGKQKKIHVQTDGRKTWIGLINLPPVLSAFNYPSY